MCDMKHCFQHEIILTRQLQHPNVLPYHAAFVSGPEVVVVSTLMAYGSCKDLLSSHFTDGLPELAIASILRDVLQGLDYVHRKGYIHRYGRWIMKRFCILILHCPPLRTEIQVQINLCGAEIKTVLSSII